MRPGVPGFVPDRLREAREARGLTQTALSELLGVSREAVSQYERDASVPSPETLSRISDVLRVPVNNFMLPSSEDEPSPFYYRSMSSATKRERIRSERRFAWLARIVDYLEWYVEFPDVNIPKLSIPDDYLAIDDGLMEESALELRRRWRLGDGPIEDVVNTLESNGIIVARFFFDAASLDAFSHWRYPAGRPFVILGSDKEAAAKSRFDAAHELAHLLLHRGLTQRTLRKQEEFKEIERQAHKFAGAFLLPEESFARDFLVPTLGFLETLKKKWNVSIGAMIMRASSLGLIGEDQATRLWRAYARRGYRRGEPLDDVVEPESPTLLRNSLILLLDEGVETRESILSELHLSEEDVQTFLGLDDDFFARPQAAQTLRFRTKGKRSAEKGSDKPPGGSSVIPFPA